MERERLETGVKRGRPGEGRRGCWEARPAHQPYHTAGPFERFHQTMLLPSDRAEGKRPVSTAVVAGEEPGVEDHLSRRRRVIPIAP